MRVFPPHPPPYQVGEAPAPTPAAHHARHPKTWQTALIGVVMTAVSSVAGLVTSHWGGLTRAEMDTALKEAKEEIFKKIDDLKARSSRDSDDLHSYVDEQIQDRIDRLGLGGKKPRKPARRERDE